MRTLIKAALFLMLIIIFSGCGSSNSSQGEGQQNQSARIVEYVNDTKIDVESAAKCWVQDNGAVYGKAYGDKSCTALARLLTNAPGYGIDPVDKKGYGGLEYIKIQEQKGKSFSLLSEAKNSVKPCDNLVFFRNGDDPIGHTAVVFSIDAGKDKLDYLDQNVSGSGINMRSIKISEIGNEAYVIPSTCKNEIKNEVCVLKPVMEVQSLEISNPDASADNNDLPTDQTIDPDLLKPAIPGFYAIYERKYIECYTTLIADNYLHFIRDNECPKSNPPDWYKISNKATDKNGEVTFFYENNIGESNEFQVDPYNDWISNNRINNAFWFPSKNFSLMYPGFDLGDLKREETLFNFQGIQNTTINGNSESVMVYTCESPEVFSTPGFENDSILDKVTGYYDSKTGILLKMEYIDTVTKCKSCKENLIGKEIFRKVYELKETNIK